MENKEPITNQQKIDVMDALYTRRAVRNFLPQKIDSAIIQRLLDTAAQAPSALHEDSRAFVVIQDKKLMDRISESAKMMTTNEAHSNKDLQRQHVLGVVQQKEFNVFYNAQTLIVICSAFKGEFVTADCWLAAENLMLAALTYGLGSCVIGLSVPALNLPEWKKELGISKKMTAVAPIIIGWPADAATLPPEHTPPQILKWD